MFCAIRSTETAAPVCVVGDVLVGGVEVVAEELDALELDVHAAMATSATTPTSAKHILGRHDLKFAILLASPSAGSCRRNHLFLLNQVYQIPMQA